MLSRWWMAVPGLAISLLLPGGAGTAPSPRNANYIIEVRLDPESKLLRGREWIIWRNIQDRPARELCFHLYYNAWKHPNTTWMREAMITAPTFRGRPVRRIPPEDWSWIRVDSIVLFRPDGTRVDLSRRWRYVAPDDGNPEDETVMVVPLPQPVTPGQSVRLELTFTAKVPRTFARTGFRGDYFLIAQWFPKLGVYEAGGRWNCHQFHYATEFYSDYGVYDVRITVPARFIVGATGRLVEREEHPDGTVTYRFVQEDVHDFAWTASPHFIEVRDRFEHPGLPPVHIRLLLQPEHRNQAVRYLEATKAALRYYGTWFGPYPYGHLTVVDPAYGSRTGGMEYPTFFTTGTRLWNPRGGGSPEEVTIHECGHQFWYGLVGNNEFEHAWLDEGINTYTTGRVMQQVYGDRVYVRRFFRGFIPLAFRDIRYSWVTARRNGYRPYATSDVPAHPSYRYFPLSGRRITYHKTALWLYTLEQYIGWDRMRQILSTFFHRYRFRHPRPEDFFAVANEVAGEDLREFFEQVYERAEAFDYEVAIASTYPIPPQPGVQSDESRRYRSHVVVRRNGGAHLPVDVLIVFKDGSRIRERWDGRDRWVMYVYEKPVPLVYAVVDPDRKLALDLFYTNNSRRVKPRNRFPAVKWAAKWMVWLQDLLLTVAEFI